MQLLIPESRIVFASFFIFGLLNNILYVVILSAAIDLVGLATPKATVLLADIIPSFTIKVMAPFFVGLISYRTRIWMLVGLSSFGMLVISLTSDESINAKIVGICMASLSSGLGEVTFLQLTHFYQREYSISGFSSGTGGAGLLGSFVFMLLTNMLGMKVWVVLLLFAVLPLGFLMAFYVMLPKARGGGGDEPGYEALDSLDERSDPSSNASFSLSQTVLLKGHVVSTIKNILPLIRPYMLPLCLVYVSEYIINQGISPTLLFPLDELPHWLFSSYRDIYVVYGFMYQLGVFVSRSSISFGIRIKRLYLLSVLQFANVVITVYQSVHDKPFSSVWLLLALIFYEGLLGGFLYVNTFMSVSEEVSKSKREFSMGCVGISDTFGILLAGCINWSLEPHLCSLQVNRGRDWCLNGGSA
jgi:battenin